MNYCCKIVIFFILISFSLLMSGCVGEDDEDLAPICDSNQTLLDGECIDNEVPDTTPPVIVGMQNWTYITNEMVPNYLDGVSATDDKDGDLTSEIIIDLSHVDYTVDGVYDIHYTVEDAAGNVRIEIVTVTVTVFVPDCEALLEEDMENLSIPLNVDALMEEQFLDMPTSGDNGTSFIWTSNYPEVINTEGFVMNPYMNEDPVTVHLTVDAVNNTETAHAEFDVVVQPYQNIRSISTVEMPFNTYGSEVEFDSVPSVDVYFVDRGAVPYIDVETFIALVDDAIALDVEDVVYIDDDKLELSYDPVLTNFIYFNGRGIYEPDHFPHQQTMIIDFTENTVTVSSYQFFALMSEVRFDVDLSSMLITHANLVEGNEVVIPFGDFNIDFKVYQHGEKICYLMPLHIISFLMFYETYYNVYYDGESISAGTIESSFWDYPEIIMSYLNGQDVPYDVRLFSYNFVSILMDYFSANKYYREIDSYREVFQPYKSDFLTGSTYGYYRTLARMISIIDDSHAGVNMYFGYYSSTPVRPSPITTSD